MNTGIRLLLANPLLTADCDGFELVVKHREPIAEWFKNRCGWRLHVERGYVLLRKTGRSARPARTANGAPFDRRRYTLLCLVCAELLETPATTAELLWERVATEDSEAFDDVIEFLEQRSVLTWVENRYRVDRTLIRRLTEPSTVDNLMCRLVDEPVVYNASPTPELRRGVEEAGFILEERAEGLLLVDPDGIATDTKFPDDSHAKTAALALLDLLPATQAELEAVTQELITKYRVFRDEQAQQLTQQAIDVLVGFGLATWDGTTARALPAAGRYRP